ncbi:MAG TPA: hypothetical protein ENG50_02805 [Candidatus Altiarchaeales archaeon]|nr:hypothetical protein [Candidatus Altiarchaeales archaeon]
MQAYPYTLVLGSLLALTSAVLFFSLLDTYTKNIDYTTSVSSVSRFCSEIDKLVKLNEHEIARSIEVDIVGTLELEKNKDHITLYIEGKTLKFPLPDVEIKATSPNPLKIQNRRAVIVVFYGDEETCKSSEKAEEKIKDKKNAIVICDK